VGFRLPDDCPGGVRAALENIGDEHRLARQTHRLDDTGEELTGLADERFALHIFVRARGFTHEEQLGIGIPDAEDDLRAGFDEGLAFLAGQHPVTEGLHRSGPFLRGSGLGAGCQSGEGNGCGRGRGAVHGGRKRGLDSCLH
jgi:hypothetical protein